ncbi:MAG TPA: hypothetical protein VGH57_35570 [Amycolatopsis sp.]|jgi:hypothetical protein
MTAVSGIHLSRPALAVVALLTTAALVACGPGTTPGQPIAEQAAAATPAYVLAPPATVHGDPIVPNPTSAAAAQMTKALTQATSDAGVSGTPVRALYDDSADDAWLVVLGVNGRGFDPHKMLAIYGAAPQTRIDGTGDRLTVTGVPGTAGAHGGSAVCQETVAQGGPLAVEASVCYWLTPTTFGLVTLYPKHDGREWGFGWPATKIDALMTEVRPEVERQA